jgi:hypothetical protein
MNLTITPEILSGAEGPITADSTPVIDSYFLPGITGPGVWNCEDWIRWHQLNREKYGKAQADEKFILSFGGQPRWTDAFNFCKYNSTFQEYFTAQGIDVSSILSRSADAITDTVDNAGSLLKNTSALLSYAVPAAVVLVLYIAWENRNDVNKIIEAVNPLK